MSEALAHVFGDKAKIVHSSRGARGGYRLAKPATEITLWDITAAIEGNKSAFTCTEIRQNGPCGSSPKDCKQLCPIASVYLDAENAFRASLASMTLADISIRVLNESSKEHISDIMTWLADESVSISGGSLT